ncbi:MAG: GNAT family N-acetyltransferase [Burkholderiales bacterium]|nr:GNAT family N-acetyltransferase [Burkholderiales bacterium]
MLRLDPMTEPEFQEYLRTAVAEYAQAHIKAGDIAPADAMEAAQEDYAQLLPQGLASPGQHLFTARDEGGDSVGMVWFAVKPMRRGGLSAYIYDVQVNAAMRGRGLGRQLMEAFEQRAREMQVGRVNLNVFGYNTAARSLYEKLGYGIAGIGMTKAL